jgi:hypothetical protein
MGLVFSRRHIGEALSLAYPLGARRQLRPQLISRQPRRIDPAVFPCRAFPKIMRLSGSLSSCKRGFKTQATLGRRKGNPRPHFGRGTVHDADAKAAVAELLKLKPGYTVQQWADWYKKFSNNPNFLPGIARKLPAILGATTCKMRPAALHHSSHAAAGTWCLIWTLAKLFRPRPVRGCKGSFRRENHAGLRAVRSENSDRTPI